MRTPTLHEVAPEIVPPVTADERTRPERRPSRLIARRVTVTAAHSRLERELRSIVLDLLGPADPAWLPADTRAWVDSTTGEAVEAVCDASLASLVEHLDAVIATAPADVISRLDEATDQVTAGLE